MLTKSDKLEIINSKLRQLEYRKYGLELDAIVENAKATPDESAYNVIQDAIEEVDNQVSALNSELSAVNQLTE